MKKRIVVISGVTGAIGSALLAEYAHDENTVVYGISRKARPVKDFLRNGKLPLRTLICSIGRENDYSSLFRHMDYGVDEIVYVHAIGLFPFEVNHKGVITVENDRDGDGVNDEVTKLTFDAFVNATTNLHTYWRGKTACILFGGMSDKYYPLVHQSWCKTMEKVKGYMRREVKRQKELSMLVFNISSVLCPHELITRSFVFTDTDADQTCWLSPHELVKFVLKETTRAGCGFREFEKFRKKPNFSPEVYYANDRFTPRKVKELY
ncbi:MAG: hypothetical protein PHS53_01370 [Candidatus Pacebacteria bacterium]|nr:hypothetical protein [Candidatus Paceibacterota bacterium]MDD5356782.1 hypothetical protein [Candidatus Paceibacterota bacterium]